MTTIPIERLATGIEIVIPDFGAAEVYAVDFDGEGYLIKYCTDDRHGWDALETHYVEAGKSVEHAYADSPRWVRSRASISDEEWEAKASALTVSAPIVRGADLSPAVAAV